MVAVSAVPLSMAPSILGHNLSLAGTFREGPVVMAITFQALFVMVCHKRTRFCDRHHSARATGAQVKVAREIWVPSCQSRMRPLPPRIHPHGCKAIAC